MEMGEWGNRVRKMTRDHSATMPSMSAARLYISITASLDCIIAWIVMLV